MKALSARAADGTPLEFDVIALRRFEARPAWVPKGITLPAVRLRYRVTGERRQAGPLRARHFGGTITYGPGGQRTAMTTRPAWRVARWFPLDALPRPRKAMVVSLPRGERLDVPSEVWERLVVAVDEALATVES